MIRNRGALLSPPKWFRKTVLFIFTCKYKYTYYTHTHIHIHMIHTYFVHVICTYIERGREGVIMQMRKKLTFRDSG